MRLELPLAAGERTGVHFVAGCGEGAKRLFGTNDSPLFPSLHLHQLSKPTHCTSCGSHVL